MTTAASTEIEQTIIPVQIPVEQNVSGLASDDDSAERVPEPSQISPMTELEDKTEIQNGQLPLVHPSRTNFPGG